MHVQPPRTQIFEASTLYGLATIVAAIEQGLFDAESTGRRILVTSNNAAIPEATPDLADSPGFDELAATFDQVRSFNDAIRPLHPSLWRPTLEEAPMWERYFRQLWDLGGEPAHLVMESIQVSPAQALALAFPQASIDIYADGLMSYGPTRTKIDAEIGSRIDRVLHLDLVPGLEPLLLDEFPCTNHLIDTERVRSVLAKIAEKSTVPAVEGKVAVLLGQYLSSLKLISPEDEERLHTQLVEGAARRGFTTVVFKPHPTAPADLAGPMLDRAAELGVEVVMFGEPVLAEALYQRLDVGAVFGCFSTGLMTAKSLYGIDAYRVGTHQMLAALQPYPNSNRIPLVIIDSVLPTPTRPARLDVTGLAQLVQAVGYVMQPEILSAQRASVTDFLTIHHQTESRFFPAERLGELDLPGGKKTIKTRVTPMLRKTARRAYAMERRLESRFMGGIKGIPGGG